ncbi:MAG: hypothetical protein Q4C03_08170 [bacterium]|nr:hypothetical protein [bacterium]
MNVVHGLKMTIAFTLIATSIKMMKQAMILPAQRKTLSMITL